MREIGRRISHLVYRLIIVKSQITNSKFQTKLKLQFQMSKMILFRISNLFIGNYLFLGACYLVLA